METPLALRMDWRREGKSWALSEGRNARGMEWIKSCVSFGAGLKRSQGELFTGKALLNLEVRGAK